MRLRTGVLWVAVSAATVLVWGLAATGAAADVVIGCGSAITEDTVLTHDLVGCEDGLTVAAADVTLDLDGHQILGQGAGGSGVLVESQGVVVRNGSIAGFGVAGVRMGLGSSETTVSNLVLSSNGIGVLAFDHGRGLRVENSTIHDNQDDGVRLFEVASVVIVNNRVLDNGAGINVAESPLSLVEGNLVMRNASGGIFVSQSLTNVIGNTSSRNGGPGISVFGECGRPNAIRLGSNVANDNQGLGIAASPECAPELDPFDLLDAGGNAAKGNSDPRQCSFQVECARNRGQAN